MFISLIFGIIDGIKASAFAHILPAWTQRLPLAEQGLAWLMPTVVDWFWRLSGTVLQGVR
jgi:LIVCS family branched-chain amino acid:cation transporter